MRKRRFHHEHAGRGVVGAAAAAALIASCCAPALAAEPVPLGAAAVPGELIVQFEPGVSGSERAAARRRADVQAERAMLAPGQQVVSVADGRSATAAAARLERDPRVRYAQPNYIRRKRATPDDPRFIAGEQWGLTRIGAPSGWDVTTGDPSLIVAVVDEGVAYDHPDLAGNIWESAAEVPGNLVDEDGSGCLDDVHGCDFVDGDGDPRDFGGHGTHVAGIAAAEGNNGVGVTGVNWHATIMPVRVLDFFGGSDADVADGFRYAAMNGARIVNASLGGPFFSHAMSDAIADFPNTLFVVAAGNGDENGNGLNNDDPSEQPHGDYPCNFTHANLICVAATDQSDTLATFSNTGPVSVDLAAPGVDVLSTFLNRAPILSDDFENLALFETQWDRQNSDWDLAAPDSPDSTSVTDSPVGDYQPNSNEALETLGAADLRDRRGCSLRFDVALDLAVPADPNPPTQDVLWVERSANGGLWTPVAAFIETTGDEDMNGRPDFFPVEVDLRADDTEVFVRFRLEDDPDDGPGAAAIEGDGAYVDDVSIGCAADVPPVAAYGLLDGTSMASPHVAGAAALVLAARPALTVAELRHVLLSSGDPLPSLAGVTVTGRRLNVNNALAAPADPPPPPPTPPAQQQPPPAPPPSPPAPAPIQPRSDPPAPARDGTAPRLSFTLGRGQRLRTVARRGLRGLVRCDEACAVRVDLVLDARTARRLGLTRGRRSVVIGRWRTSLDESGRRRATIRLTRRARARLRRARSLQATLRATATDPAGNRRRVSRRVRLRR